MNVRARAQHVAFHFFYDTQQNTWTVVFILE